MRLDYIPYLIILDKDFEVAAKMLTEKDLTRQIHSGCKLLLNVYFKQYGLTNKKVWEHVIETNDDILDKAFPEWPLKKYLVNPPKCKIKEFKFVKLCLNNYKYVLQYLNILCDEYEERFRKQHPKYVLINWVNEHLPNLPYAKNYNVETYPILTIPIKYRKNDYITSARQLYKSLVENPLEEYLKVDVPDFFNLKEII